jgi:hypothetical protein
LVKNPKPMHQVDSFPERIHPKGYSLDLPEGQHLVVVSLAVAAKLKVDSVKAMMKFRYLAATIQVEAS